jgi:hypothetical protein
MVSLADLREGEWVYVFKHDGTKELGFIVMVGPEKTRIRLLDGTDTYRVPKNIEKAGLDLTDEDIDAMIDLALDTGDQDWFINLTERKRGLR